MGTKTILAVLFVSSFIVPVFRLSANPLREPHRAINGRTVDLAPLFKWWNKHEGPRPLAAWVRVTGTIVGTNAWGWVVEAKLEKTERRNKGAEEAPRDSGRIVLRTPPWQEKSEFETLRAQLNEFNTQRASVAGQETRAANQVQALARERASRRRLRALAVEEKQARDAASQDKQELQSLDRQIQEVKKKLAAYPNSEHYEVDCFALDTGQAYDRLAVFDHGQGYP